MLFDGEPLVICAQARSNSRAMPFSIIRLCEGCGVKLMTAPSSAPMIEAGAHACCMPCAAVVRAVVGETDDGFELVPGSLEEVAEVLGPEAAAQSAALVESMNRAIKRDRN